MVHLNQQFISRNPLNRFDHQITQTLFLLVLTHVLLLEQKTENKREVVKKTGTQESPKQRDRLFIRVTVALHVSTTRWRSGPIANPGLAWSCLWLKAENRTWTWQVLVAADYIFDSELHVCAANLCCFSHTFISGGTPHYQSAWQWFTKCNWTYCWNISGFFSQIIWLSWFTERVCRTFHGQ